MGFLIQDHRTSTHTDLYKAEQGSCELHEYSATKQKQYNIYQVIHIRFCPLSIVKKQVFKTLQIHLEHSCD